MSTVKTICDSLPPLCLDHTISDLHIAEMAKVMTEWQELAPFLDITRAEENEIVEQYRGRLQLQKREALQKWKEKNGSKATYRRLIVIFCTQSRVNLAEALKGLLLTSHSESQPSISAPPTQDVIDVFHDYLREGYSDLPHPSSLQWPDCPIQIYVDLKLLDVPVKGLSSERNKPIPLESLFAAGNSQAKRKVILIEGIAGVGKTTLSWHACKEWAAGKLFKDAKLLIHVPFSDPIISHWVTKLVDLIPHPSETIREKVAEAITSCKGKGICFWLEGCDETPPSLWKSFLHRFVAGTEVRSMLPDAQFILTSRPGSRAILELDNTFTGKVIITGFHSLESFVSSCSLRVTKDELLEALRMKPELYSLCYLPLNAVILVYLYDNYKDDLPVTRTGLFDLLVRNFIVRHMKHHTTYEAISIENFPTDLPDDIRLSLSKVSELAYKSLLQRKKIIDQKILSEFGLASIDNALGLLQVQLRPTMRGPSKHFSFIHLSLQEFLAAFHIHHNMSKDEQVVATKSVFDQNPLSPVLALYAGLNGLVIKEVRDVILSVLRKPHNIADIVRELKDHKYDPAHDLRRQLLSLMNCLYETQKPDLFAHVDLVASDIQDLLAREALRLQSADEREANSQLQLTKDANIFLAFMHLYPADCLSVGYFVRHVRCGTENRVYLDLSNAVLAHMEIKALMQELHKPSPNNVYLNINGVFLTTYALHCLNTLFHPLSCLIGLELSCTEILNIPIAMKYFIEGYARTRCKSLTLGYCHSNVIHHMILLLTCSRQLRVLNLTFSTSLFARPGLMRLFCEALVFSKVQRLNLDGCNISDNTLMILATAVCHKNCLLTILEIDRNPYTEQGLTNFLRNLQRNLHFVYLMVLSVNHINDEHYEVVDSINYCRKNYKILEYPHQLLLSCASQLRSQYENKDKGYFSLMRFDLAFGRNHH